MPPDARRRLGDTDLANQLKHTVGIEQPGVLRRREWSLGRELEEPALAVDHGEKLVLFGVQRDIDEILELVRRFEERLLAAHSRHQRLGVRSPLDALDDDLPQRDLDTHQLARVDGADPEGHLALFPGEEAPDDRFDVLADRLKGLRRRQRPLLDQELSQAPAARRTLRHRGPEVGLREPSRLVEGSRRGCRRDPKTTHARRSRSRGRRAW